MSDALRRLAVALLCVASAVATVSPVRAAPPADDMLRAYVFGTSGAYVAVAPDLRESAPANLSRAPGIAPWLPEGCSPHSVRCYWQAAGVAYDRAAGIAFAIVPERDNPAPAERTAWQVIAFRLPRLAPAGRAALGRCDLPTLLPRPAQGELLVKCTLPKPPKAAAFETRVTVFDARTLKPKRTISEKTDEQQYMMAQAVVNAGFSDKAVFNAAGDTIFSGLVRIRFTGTSFASESIDPEEALDATGRRTLEPFHRVQPVNNARWLPRSLAGADGPRALIMAPSADGASMALWTVDIERNAATPVVVVPAGVAHLMAKGSRILLEATKPIPADAISNNAEKLGTWAVYDTATGQRLSEKSVPIAAGPPAQSELVCLWPDGGRALYRQKSRLYAVEIGAAGGTRELTAGFAADPPLSCVFAP